MLYEQLHRRYGTIVAQRVRRELDDSEFNQIGIDDLPVWLEQRAEKAHDHFKNLQKNTLAETKIDAVVVGEACRCWREYEDLAYLVAIAEDVSANARRM